MSDIRVFIADDHELVRMALRSLLDGEADLEVVGEAADTQAAIDGVLACRPNVLVLDLRMPGGGGVEVCRAVKERAGEVAVLVITSFDGDEELFGALEAGANGYLMKDTAPDHIVNAVRSVHDGQVVFDASIATRIVSGRTTRRPNELLPEPLSERELEVLGLMAQGMPNRQIARTLWISEATVKTHVSHILRKLAKTDRAQAVLTAVALGLVRLRSDDEAHPSV